MQRYGQSKPGEILVSRVVTDLVAGADPAPRAPLQTWHAFAFLIVTAVVLYCAKWPILIVAGMVGFFRGLFWLCERYPRTMFVIMVIGRALLATGRGRR